VVDGGVAQLHAGMSVLKKFWHKIPVVSVLKDEKHKPKIFWVIKNLLKKKNIKEKSCSQTAKRTDSR